MTEQKHFQIPEFQDKELYMYISQERVSNALSLFGYGASKKFVDALYISPDQSIGVGIMKVTEERCIDHFGVLSGMDQG